MSLRPDWDRRRDAVLKNRKEGGKERKKGKEGRREGGERKEKK
jgi:hypothetical protein